MGPPWVLFGGGANGFPRATAGSSGGAMGSQGPTPGPPGGPMGPRGPWVQIGSANQRKNDPGSLQVEHEPRGVHEPMRCKSLGGA